MRKRIIAVLILITLVFANICTALAEDVESGQEKLLEKEDIKRMASDSFSGARQITLGSTINDSITEGVTERYYKFTLTSSGRVSWRFVNIDGIKVYFQFYDVDYKRVGNSYYAVETEDMSIDLTKGTYYLQVERAYSTGEYNLKTKFESADETYTGDNGTVKQANTISLGKTIKGHIADNRTSDYYKFTLPFSGKVSWRFINADGIKVYFQFYDVDYKRVGNSYYAVETEDMSIDLTKGTYYLQVEGAGSTGAYSLRTAFTTGSLNNASVSLSVSRYTYDGHVKTPSVRVKCGGKTLVSGRDYKVTYKNNKTPGTARAVIKGTGYYEGSVVKRFTIRPKGTSLTFVASGSRGFTAKWKKQTVQVSGYQIQYAVNSRFTSGKRTIAAGGRNSSSKRINGLRPGKRYYVRVRTYKTVSGTRYYSAWSKAKKVTARR